MAGSWSWKACPEGAVHGRACPCTTEITRVLRLGGEALSSGHSTKIHGAVACCLLMRAAALAPRRIRVSGMGGNIGKQEQKNPNLSLYIRE